VARCGRAEVLRELGRPEEALQLYEETARDFPRDEVARNGRASGLVDLARYDEALALLPSGPPRTRDDWIAQHIGGMIHLRCGELAEAQGIFENGVRNCPYLASVAYFRSALAVTQIQRGRFREVELALEGSQTDVARVLRFHAYGELRETDAARGMFEALRTTQRKRVADLRGELASVYLFSPPERPSPSSEWRARVFAAECALVRAA
jgi:tetratricopeptide (TPR) repeat protein